MAVAFVGVPAPRAGAPVPALFPLLSRLRGPEYRTERSVVVMRCTIHPTTVQDVANVLLGHGSWTGDGAEDGRDCMQALLEACAVSQQVWTASTADGEPLALIGAAPWMQDRGLGRLWFVVLSAYGGNEADLTMVMRLSVAEMLQVFAQLENHVSAEKAWALGLMRGAGFTVEAAQPSPDGVERHRVWIDAGGASGAA